MRLPTKTGLHISYTVNAIVHRSILISVGTWYLYTLYTCWAVWLIAFLRSEVLMESAWVGWEAA